MLSAFTVGKYFPMDKVHDIEDKLLTQTEKFLDEVDKIDGRMSTVWNLWKFRMGRIFTPNFVSHIKSIISLCLSVLQIIIILQLVHDTGGHFANLPHLRVILFPLYVQYGLRLVIQLSTFLFVLYRVIYEEKDHRIHLHFNELNRFLPVIEHLMPVFTYIVILLACISFGYCHMDERGGTEGICQVFSVKIINTISILLIIFHCLHYLISIYHNKRHTSLPQKHSSLQDYEMKETKYDSQRTKQPTNFISSLEDVNQEMTLVYNWWKYRMNRLFSSIVTHNVCNIIDAILEGTQVVVLVNAISSSHGDLSNLNTVTMLLPTYFKLFLKAFIQTVALICVCRNTYSVESKLSFIEFLREPNKTSKIFEHVIPVVSYLMLGLVTIAIGQCHLGGMHAETHSMCQFFSFELVIGILISGALIQFGHHVLSIYHVKRHSGKPTKGERKSEVEAMSSFSGNTGEFY